MSKKRMITKSVIFLLILAFILKIFSSLSIAMGYNANPLYNYSSYSIFQEPDNSIDVLSIGDSNVYSSIFPLVWCCLLYTSPSPRDGLLSRMPSSA